MHRNGDVMAAEERWKTAIESLSVLIDEMHAGIRPALSGDLSAAAAVTVANATGREHEKVGPWAMALALEISCIDD
jgi:hypothetical protein